MTDDAMVPIATLFSRSEALSVAAMLDASGIVVHVGGEHYAGATLNIVAMGGFRLTVPASQYEEASTLLYDVAAQPPFFSHAARRRVSLLLGVIGLTIVLPAAYAYHREGELTLGSALLLALSLSTTPVPPQARGEYHLAVRPESGD